MYMIPKSSFLSVSLLVLAQEGMRVHDPVRSLSLERSRNLVVVALAVVGEYLAQAQFHRV